jgi:autotransporter-associated beta strand protein
MFMSNRQRHLAQGKNLSSAQAGDLRRIKRSKLFDCLVLLYGASLLVPFGASAQDQIFNDGAPHDLASTTTDHAVLVNGGSALNIGSGSNLVVNTTDGSTDSRVELGNGGNGTLNLGGGTITFNIADSASAPAASIGRIWIGGGADNTTGGNGTLNMSAGTIEFVPEDDTTLNYGAIAIGRGANVTGNFNQSGGVTSFQSSGAVDMGGAGGTGTYTLSNAAVFDASHGGMTMYVGSGSSTSEGTGTVRVSDNAQFTMTTGPIAGGQFYVGDARATGTFIQEGAGSVVTLGLVNPILFGSNVGAGGGANGGGTGSYVLSAGTLNVENVGGSGRVVFGAADGGSGTFTLSGGQAHIATNVAVAETTGSTGLINQSGGTLSLIDGARLVFGSGNGAYRLLGGSLLVGGADGLSGSGALTFGNATLGVQGSDLTSNMAATLTAGTHFTFDTQGLNADWSGVLSGDGALTKAGDGTLTLSAANTYGGTTTIDRGTLALVGAGDISNSAGLVDNGTLDISGMVAAGITLPNLSGSGTILNGTRALAAGSDNSDTRFSGTIVNANNGWDAEYGTFTKIGSGTLTIDDATIEGGESYIVGGAMAQTSGNTEANFLSVGSGVTDNQPNAGVLNVSGGTLGFTTALQVGDWGGTGTVNQTGGDVTVTAGCDDPSHCASISIGNQGGTGIYNISGGTLTFDNGVFDLGRNDTDNPPGKGTLNLSGNGAVTLDSGEMILGDNLAGATEQAFAPPATGRGTGMLNQSGGTLTFSGTSGFYLSGSGDGTYNLDGGTLRIGGSSLHGSYNNLGGNYAFNLGGGTIQVIGSMLAADLDATLVGGSTSTIDTGGIGATWSGTLSGDGALTKTGDGTLTLTGANTYTGITSIDRGTLALSGAGSIGDSAGLIDNGTFDISALAATDADTAAHVVLPSLSGSGTVINGTNSLAVGSDNSDGNFSGTIVNANQGWDPAYGTFAKVGTGTLTIDGATITGGESYIVDGAMAQTGGDTSIDYLAVGSGASSNGALHVSDGTITFGTGLEVGAWGGSGTVEQTGGNVVINAGCQDLGHCASLSIGNQGGTGSYDLSGGTVSFDSGFVVLGRNDAVNPASTGILNLSGTGNFAVSNGSVIVGDNSAMTGPGNAGTGTIHQNGGTLAIDGTSSLYLSGSGDGTYNLNGGTLQIGGSSLHGSYNNLGGSYAFNLGGGTIQATGSMLDTDVDAMLVDGSTSTIDTGDVGTRWAGTLSGDGALTKTGDSTLTLTRANTYTGITTIAGGTLALSGAGSIGDSAGLVDNGVFDISAVAPLSRSVTRATLARLSGTGRVILGANTLAIGTGAGDSSFSGVITGAGGVDKMGSGMLILDGVNDYSGNTDVQDGMLIVGSDGAHSTASIAGDVDVNAGATLGGHGHIGGDVTVQTDGHLAPGNSIGTLNIGGDLDLAQDSQLDFEFGANGQGDRVAVAGNLNAQGAALNIDGDLGPGMYTLFTWNGELTGSGDDAITLGGAPRNGVSIQTLADDKQINLINTDGLTLKYWNGNGLANADRMGGGDGTWSTLSKNWTDKTGSVSAPMQPQPGFAIFGGAAGHVTVDDNDGTVSVSGMQFASNGYHLDGDALALAGDPLQRGDSTPVIRVGAGYAATIDNVLTGHSGLNKSDAGTLVLTGDNTYTGTTMLSGGTLSVSSDQNLGDAGNTLDFEGGMLQVNGSAFHGTARTILWGDAGGGFDIADAGNSFSVAQALGGTGSLTKRGDGTLILGGANTYSGGTTISGGTLQGDTTSLQGDMVDNARLVFAQGTDGRFAGSVSGSGSLDKDGDGTLVLAGTNSYSGGTTVSGGTLQGDTRSLQGNIADNARLVFDQDASGTFVGAISGDGSLSKDGSGTVILAGINTYSGGTTIHAGTLQGDSRSLQGDITDNGRLAFDQDDNGVFAGTISGSGTLGKDGSGALILTGANTYSGGTTVSGGTLQGDTRSLQGDITDDAHLVFDQVSDGAFAGTVTGSGSLGKDGSGTLILTSANTYSGGTTISAGTLQGDTRSLQGDIADDAHLVFDQDSDGTFAGAINGSGSLDKDGSGTLILAGANSYHGGTVVNAGTLQGDARSLQGDIADNAHLVFDQADDGVFSGTLSGTGDFTKNGAGKLIINSSNPLEGDVMVAGGTLVVGDDGHADASLAGTVTVNSGGALGGFGHVGGLDLFGTLTPGNSIGTLTVNGNAVFEKGSSYRIEAAPNGDSDRLAVNGKLSILGGSALALGSEGDWSPRTQYTILTAKGGIDGKFDSVSSNLAFLTPDLSYSAGAIGMTLERNNVSFASVAQTANQRAAGGAADVLGFGNTIYDSLVKLDASAARGAFDQLSGEVHASTRTALIDDSRYVRDAISNHILGLDNGRNAANANGVSAWTSVWGHWGDHDSDGNAAAANANGSGLLVGADLPVGSSGKLGAVIGNGQSSMQVDARRATAHAKATHLGAYGSVQGGQFSLQGGVAYSWQNVNSYRQLAFGDFASAAGGRYHADTLQAYADGSYAIGLDHGTLAPFLDLARVQLRTDAFRESGSAGLAVASQNSAVNYATLGLRGSLALDAARGIQAHAGLGWQHAWGDIAERSTLQFAGASDAFAVAGTPVTRNAAAVNVGVSWAVARKVSVDASYNGQFASHAKDQSARMSLTWQF